MSVYDVLQRHREAAACDRILRFAKLAPLDEITADRHPDGHWHYATVGLSRQGWDFELSLRAPAKAGGDAPQWPVRVLHQLASYVIGAKAPILPNHHLDLGASLDREVPMLTALAVTADLELPGVHQVVGLHADEEALVARWSTREFLAALAEREPLLVTRPRPSLLADPTLARDLESRARGEGPGSSKVVAEVLAWRRGPRFTIDLGPAQQARRNLRRLVDGNLLDIRARDRELVLASANSSELRQRGDRVEIHLSPAARNALGRFLDSETATFSIPDLNVDLNLVT